MSRKYFIVQLPDGRNVSVVYSEQAKALTDYIDKSNTVLNKLKFIRSMLPQIVNTYEPYGTQ